MADDPTPDAATAPDPAPADEPTAPELGEAGKKALDKERAAVKALRAEVSALKPLADEAQRLKDANKTEAERQAEALQATARERDEALAASARLQVVVDKGIRPDELALMPKTGTQADFEAAADLLIAHRGDEGRPRSPAPIFEQGTGGSRSPTQSPRDAFSQFVGDRLGGSKS